MNVLLLRGLSREQRHWGSFLDVLLSQSPGTRVFCLDLPGTGTEFRRESPATIRGIVEDLRSRWLLLRESHAEPWSLFAISLGGMVAMDWCAAYPDDFASVILCNTSAANLSRPWRRFDARILPLALQSMTERDPVRREKIVLRMTTRLQPQLEPTATRWASYQKDRPVSRATILKQLWAAARFVAPDRLLMPTLIVAGGRDPMTDPSCPRKLSAHFGAPLEVHPEAGHELALDAPEWLAARIADWLEKQQPSIQRIA